MFRKAPYNRRTRSLGLIIILLYYLYIYVVLLFKKALLGISRTPGCLLLYPCLLLVYNYYYFYYTYTTPMQKTPAAAIARGPAGGRGVLLVGVLYCDSFHYNKVECDLLHNGLNPLN